MRVCMLVSMVQEMNDGYNQFSVVVVAAVAAS